MDYDPSRLTKLGAKFQRLRAEVDALRPDLADEIRAAHEAGMAQVEIVRLTGYTRELVRQICLPPDQKPTRAKSTRR